MPWQSRIDVWEPGVSFVDRQLVGPYRWWRHEHRFEVVRGGTRMIDQVDYAPRVVRLSGALVRRDLQRILAYRHEVLRRYSCNQAGAVAGRRIERRLDAVAVAALHAPVLRSRKRCRTHPVRGKG